MRSRKAGRGGLGGGSVSVSLIEFPDPKILSEEAEWCNCDNAGTSILVCSNISLSRGVNGISGKEFRCGLRKKGYIKLRKFLKLNVTIFFSEKLFRK